MEKFKVNREKINQVGQQHLNLVYSQEKFSKYINKSYELESFKSQIEEKKKSYLYSQREELVQVLSDQYSQVKNTGKVQENIELLKRENTFTVATGHQLSLFTGPLYFILKILHVIKLSEKLKKEFPSQNFVPIYWMATEDHDFEEIQTMNLFGKPFTWYSEQNGPVGRFKLQGLGQVREEIKAMFSNHPDADINSLIETYHGENLADATRNLVHELFKKYGLIIIDADNTKLKKMFAPTIKKELLESFSFNAVEETNKQLIIDGSKIQVNPREINLFYILDGFRKRIIKENGVYTIDGMPSFSEEEMLAELDKNPERFSPNVILRPLYQEMILPNLAYVGGAGELSYWLQLKGVFDAVKCTYPMIGIRNSVLWIDGATSKKMTKINLEIDDLFETKDALKKGFVKNNSEGKLDFEAIDQLQKSLSDEINRLVTSIEPSMKGYASAEDSRLIKQMESLKAKLIKTSKSKHESSLKTIDQVIDKLFPNGGLQERNVNFFSFCPDGDYKSALNMLYNCIDSAEKDLIIIKE